jgi:hypothetical protein
MKTTPQTPTTDPNATGQSTQEDQRTGTAVSGQGTVGSQSSSGSQKEVKLQGCIQEQNGQYMLHSKKYKDGIAIMSSENLAAHVGHEVKVRGTLTSGSMASSQGMSQSAEHSAAHGTSGPTGSASGSTTSSTPDTSGASASTGSSASGTSDTSMQKPESDQPPSSAQAIQATSIEMVSDTCKGMKKPESSESPK